MPREHGGKVRASWNKHKSDSGSCIAILEPVKKTRMGLGSGCHLWWSPALAQRRTRPGKMCSWRAPEMTAEASEMHTGMLVTLLEELSSL